MARRAPTVEKVKASAQVVKIDDREAVRKTLATRPEWMKAAFDYTDSVGELGDIARGNGNIMSQLVLYAADTPTDREKSPEPTTNAQAIDSLERLHSRSGGLPEIQREIGELATITGDMRLIGLRPRKDKAEKWWIASPFEIEVRENKLKVADPDSDSWIELNTQGDDKDFIVRLWRPHPRRGAEAWSPVRGVIGQCETMLVMERALRAIGRNRGTLAGILLVATELGNEADPEDPESQDGILLQIFEALNAALKDEGSGAAISPIVLRVAAELIREQSAMKHIELPRTFDEMIIKVIELCEKRIAQGMNIPPEEMFGLGTTKFWGAGQVERSAFMKYHEPDAVWACNALTKGYLWPDLIANGMSEEQAQAFRIWFSADKIVVNGQRREDALNLYKVGELSGITLRKVFEFTDPEDEPTTEERARRVTERAPALERVNAAAKRQVPVGEHLADMEKELTIRLHAEAEAAMRRALERAGNKIKSTAKNSPKLRTEIQGLTASLVPSVLGRSVVASLASQDELMRDAWTPFGVRFNALVATAQEDLIDIIKRTTPAKEGELLEARMEQEQDRKEAWVWLEAALQTLATERLYDPSPKYDQGEHDPNYLVPFGLIREAVSRAGGQSGT